MDMNDAQLTTLLVLVVAAFVGTMIAIVVLIRRGRTVPPTDLHHHGPHGPHRLRA